MDKEKKDVEVEGKKEHISKETKKDKKEENEMLSKEKDGPTLTDKMRENPWVVATIAFGILSLILIFGEFSASTGAITGGSVGVATQSDVEMKVLEFANIQLGGGASVVETTYESGLYKVVISYAGQEVPIYVTGDGKNLVQGVADFDLVLQQAEAQTTTDDSSTGGIVEVSVDNDAVEGDVNAPVTIVEFSDYECPYCSKFYMETLPLLRSEYVETGKVKIIYRDFPLTSIHADAQKAAEAAECAGEQGKYYEMHDKLFENQEDLGIEALKSYAGEIGLNQNEFDACLDSGEMADEVVADQQDGISYGVTGTPSFFINGRFLGGAYPFEDFKTIIDEELASQ